IDDLCVSTGMTIISLPWPLRNSYPMPCSQWYLLHTRQYNQHRLQWDCIGWRVCSLPLSPRCSPPSLLLPLPSFVFLLPPLAAVTTAFDPSTSFTSQSAWDYVLTCGGY